jgi:hypothetical protein
MGTLKDLSKHLSGFSADLGKLQNASATIKPDGRGMIEKECPKEDCLSLFYVNIDDWKNILRDEEVFCPICERPDLANTFNSSRHLDAIREHLARSIKQRWVNGTPINKDSFEIESIDGSKYVYNCMACQTRFGTVEIGNVCPSCGVKTES